MDRRGVVGRTHNSLELIRIPIPISIQKLGQFRSLQFLQFTRVFDYIRVETHEQIRFQ